MSTEQFARKIDQILKRLDELEAQSNINYTKGTYTPTYLGGTTAGVTTYTTQQGAYTRIGKLVVATLSLTWSAATGTGNAQFSLPFAAANVASQNFSGSVRTVNVTFTNGTPQILLTATSSIFLLQSPLTNAASAIVQMEAAGNIVATVAYFID